MNYFDMIFKNSSSRELVFSSVYNYLVDKTESHGLGSIVLERLLVNLPTTMREKVIGSSAALKQYCNALYSVTAEADFGAHFGFVDSLVQFEDDRTCKPAILATAIKILAGSVQYNAGNKPQLLLYTEYLTATYGAQYILLYLVPDTPKAIEEFRNLLKVNPGAASNCCIMFWDRAVEPVSSKEGSVAANVCQQSFVDILAGILRDDSTGDVSPISTEVSYLLHCLINIIKNNFNRIEPEPTILQRFPDREQFLSNIQEHKELYEYLESDLNRSRQKASSINTSIGFPFGIAKDGNYNTLFRVLTMRNYKPTAESIRPEDYVDCLIIELDKEIYQNHFEELVDIFKSYAVVKSGFHPNGDKNPRQVYLVEFHRPVPDMDSVKAVLTAFYAMAKKAFAIWLEKMS